VERAGTDFSPVPEDVGFEQKLSPSGIEYGARRPPVKDASALVVLYLLWLAVTFFRATRILPAMVQWVLDSVFVQCRDRRICSFSGTAP
jgi:hypothetical protein